MIEIVGKRQKNPSSPLSHLERLSQHTTYSVAHLCVKKEKDNLIYKPKQQFHRGKGKDFHV